MTPQASKTSCYEVMVNSCTPSTEDKNGNRHTSNFGMTINIINCGLECGASNWDYRALDRVEFYERYLQVLGIDKNGDPCSCENMTSY